MNQIEVGLLNMLVVLTWNLELVVESHLHLCFSIQLGYPHHGDQAEQMEVDLSQCMYLALSQVVKLEVGQLDTWDWQFVAGCATWHAH